MAGDPLAPWFIVVKLVLYIASLAAAGLTLHAALGVIESERRANVLRLAAFVSTLAVLAVGARLLLSNAQLGGGLAFALDQSMFGWTWRAQGPATIAVVFGAGAMVAAAALNNRPAAMTGAIAFGASFGLTGHTQALVSPGAAPWAAGAHVFIAAFWFAAPLTLWPVAKLTNETVLARMRRFSAFAIAAVPVLFLLGLWLAWRLAGGFEPLVETAYGRLMLLKLGLATGALLLGAVNKQVVTAMMAVEPPRGRGAAKVTLMADGMLFLGALTAVTLATTVMGPAEA